ncbi:hypothetical protein GGP41_004220 [Bipolaris sorokiniana]|uniref:Uncharacterized protein n=1 Tax=Cochliobolus sativus TaxID=45130 RepID=A0A8H6DXC5_COCSA|nr:hypothetical protein GGP41_004220 [Bipolaris sorokiniana]
MTCMHASCSHWDHRCSGCERVFFSALNSPLPTLTTSNNNNNSTMMKLLFPNWLLISDILGCPPHFQIFLHPFCLSAYFQLFKGMGSLPYVKADRDCTHELYYIFRLVIHIRASVDGTASNCLATKRHQHCSGLSESQRSISSLF